MKQIITMTSKTLLLDVVAIVYYVVQMWSASSPNMKEHSKYILNISFSIIIIIIIHSPWQILRTQRHHLC